MASLGHPCKFQRVSSLGGITAWHSGSGRQPNFAALNRGRHLHSAGRQSRWALGHILIFSLFSVQLFTKLQPCTQGTYPPRLSCCRFSKNNDKFRPLKAFVVLKTTDVSLFVSQPMFILATLM